jgi:hypothetical protein
VRDFEEETGMGERKRRRRGRDEDNDSWCRTIKGRGGVRSVAAAHDVLLVVLLLLLLLSLFDLPLRYLSLLTAECALTQVLACMMMRKICI